LPTATEADLPSFSFAGCAWLFTYHLGVIERLRAHPQWSQAIHLGASSGSLAAVIAGAGVDTAAVLHHVVDFAADARARRLGPIGRMTRYVTQGLESLLPLDVCDLMAGRVKVSVTRLPQLRHELIDVGACRSRDELIRLLLGSCYIPLYYEKPVSWGGRWLIDGGLRNNQPVLDHRTVRISPHGARPGSSVDIHPARCFDLGEVLFPEPSRLLALYRDGQAGGQTWLTQARARSSSGPASARR
jgi:hypothetical protein